MKIFIVLSGIIFIASFFRVHAANIKLNDSYGQCNSMEKSANEDQKPGISSLQLFSDTAFWKYKKYLGNGTMKIYREGMGTMVL